MTTVSISIQISNGNGGADGCASQEFQTAKPLKNEDLSPKANDMLRAAAAVVGVKIPKPKPPKR